MKNLMFAAGSDASTLARRSLFLAAAGAGLLMAQTLAAQTPAAPTSITAPATFKVGVLNAEQALASTKDGQKATQELQTRLGPKNDALQKLGADIQDLQKKLDQGGNTMAAETKTQLQASIQSKTRTYQRDQQDFQDELQKQQSLLLADLYTKMQQVITKYASDNGYSLILNVATDNTPVLWVSNQIEITQAIIDAYDKAGPMAPKAPAAGKSGASSAPRTISPLAPSAPKSPAAPAK